MTNEEFTGRVALVTGAASGIGRRTAERLAEGGATTIAADIAPDFVAPHASIAVALDVTSEAAWAGTIGWIEREYDRLDILVNSAGIVIRGEIVNLPLADFRRVMAVNAEGSFLGVKHALRAMLKAGSGSIVNVSSIAGLVGSAGGAAYSASKGAVRMLTKCAALEAIAAGTSVRVNSVNPTMTDTPMLQEIVRYRGNEQNTRELIATQLPGGRFATTDEIADAILFLASDRSRFVNGSELVIDNAYTAQ